MKIQPIVSPIFIFLLLAILLGFLWWRFHKNEMRTFDRITFILKSLLIASLAFILNLRPMKATYNTEIMLKNIDVLFVVDNTISMYADDVALRRMDQVHDDIVKVMNEFDGSNFAMIRFDNSSQILSPFTQDTRNIEDILDIIQYPDTYFAKGSSLNTPYEDMEQLLISSYNKAERMTVAFFISDGEITDGSSLQSYKDLAQYIDAGAVLGYGTTNGGRMRIDSFESDYLIDNSTGSEAISKIDESTLQTIANDLEVSYIHMPDADNFQSLLTSIVNQSSSVVGDSKAVSYEDTYYYFAWALLALLFFELIQFIRRGRV